MNVEEPAAETPAAETPAATSAPQDAGAREDPRDALLQAHAPAVMVPRFGNLAPLARAGHRYLVAADGIWLEVRRAWLHARVHVAPSGIALPFGDVAQIIEYGFSVRDLCAMHRAFVRDATDAMPNEFAAWAVYDERNASLEYRPIVADEASPGRVSFQRPPLAEHEHLAIDLHSHGEMPAFFSATDDADDAGEVKLAVVVGEIGLDAIPSCATRLCLLGLFLGGGE